MGSLRFLPLIGTCAILVLCGACLITDVIPENQPFHKPSVTLSSPADGSVLTPEGTTLFHAKATGQNTGFSIFRVTIDDSLFLEEDFQGRIEIRKKFYPVEWADQNTQAVIKGIVTGPNGFTAVDSVKVTIGEYNQSPPRLDQPENNIVIMSALFPTVSLGVDPIAGYYQKYQRIQYHVGRDSLMVDRVADVVGGNSIDVNILEHGDYYWRARILGDLDQNSPWSEVWRFMVTDEGVNPPDYLSFQSILKVISGEEGFYILGITDRGFGAMHRGPDFSPRWLANLPARAAGYQLDGEALAGGDVLMACNGSMYGPQLVMLDSSGLVDWVLILNDDREINSIRLSDDGQFYCGFQDNWNDPSFMTKIDSHSIPLWEYGSGQECYQIQAGSARESAVFLAGNGTSLVVGEVDSEGEEMWAKSLNISASRIDEKTILVPISEGDFLVGSSVLVDSRLAIYLARIRVGGELIWQKYLFDEFRRARSLTLASVKVAPDGGMYLVGSLDRINWGQDLLLIHLTDDGSVTWYRTFGSNDAGDFGVDLAILEDGVMVLGYQEHPSQSPLVFKVGFDGEIIPD